MNENIKDIIFKVLIKGWNGNALIFPHKGYKNVIIKPEAIFKVIEDAIKEAEL